MSVETRRTIGKALESTHIEGGEVRVGDEIYWKNPDRSDMEGTSVAFLKDCIKEVGGGPFIVKFITLYPAPRVLVTFDDEHGNEHEMTPDWFSIK